MNALAEIIDLDRIKPGDVLRVTFADLVRHFSDGRSAEHALNALNDEIRARGFATLIERRLVPADGLRDEITITIGRQIGPHA